MASNSVQASPPSRTSLWINGKQRPAADGKTFEVRSPLTKQIVGLSASATSQDCKDAVDAAQNAFENWERAPPSTKRSIFLKAAELLKTDKYKKKVVDSLTSEVASVPFWSALDLALSAEYCYEAAAVASSIKGESFPSQSPTGGYVIVQRRAHGVILAIAPWNAPMLLSLRAVSVPLACGNTVILKPSEYSPGSQEIVVELLHEAGLPEGVLNYVPMSKEDSPRLTAELIGNSSIRHINFTGSDRVGSIIAAEAAKYLKPCVLELGGKAPAVVLDDANIEAAAHAIVNGSMLHSGQICLSTERVVVQRGISQALISRVTELSRKLKAGDPFNDSTAKLSPLFNEGSAENFLKTINEAQENGAELLLGDLTRVGAIVQPHLLQGIKPGMRAWDRESFGPVVGFAVADTVEEAIKLANASDYSLSASIWTQNFANSIELAGRIRAGSVVVNGATLHSESRLGHAGLGGATGYGRFDIEHFTVKRMITVLPGSTVPGPLTG